MWTATLVATATILAGPDPTVRAQQELELLRMGLAGYQVAHHGRYPAATSLDGLVRLLVWEGELPRDFAPTLEVEEFRCHPRGYRLRVLVAGRGLAIASPLREEPFAWWLRVGW